MFGCPIKTMDLEDAHISITGEGGSDSYACINIRTSNGTANIKFNEYELNEFIHKLQEIQSDNAKVRKGVMF